MNSNKWKIVSLVVIVVLLVVIGYFTGVFKSNNDYSIVYLSTGEVYIGKLTTFPDLQLTNAHVLQLSKDEKDPTKNTFQINPIKDAVWAPESLHLVKDNVVFYGPLSPESQIAKTLAEQIK